jgi:hypothetical protein
LLLGAGSSPELDRCWKLEQQGTGERRQVTVTVVVQHAASTAVSRRYGLAEADK